MKRRLTAAEVIGEPAVEAMLEIAPHPHPCGFCSMCCAPSEGRGVLGRWPGKAQRFLFICIPCAKRVAALVNKEPAS